MDTEIWLPVVGYEWLYEVSNLGRIKSLIDNHWLPRVNIMKTSGDSYFRIALCKNGLHKTVSIHRLVAQAFIPNPENKKCVNHISWIKTDNRIKNLEWCTHSENALHSYRVLWNKNIFQTAHPQKWEIWKYSKWSKKVFQFTKDMIFIKKWDSLMDVKRALNISPSSISSVCRYKAKSAWGFIWKYEK